MCLCWACIGDKPRSEDAVPFSLMSSLKRRRCLASARPWNEDVNGIFLWNVVPSPPRPHSRSDALRRSLRCPPRAPSPCPCASQARARADTRKEDALLCSSNGWNFGAAGRPTDRSMARWWDAVATLAGWNPPVPGAQTYRAAGRSKLTRPGWLPCILFSPGFPPPQRTMNKDIELDVKYTWHIGQGI